MNELLGICESLEGYSGEDLGFNVLFAEKCNETWKLTVEKYFKGIESPTELNNNIFIILAERLYSKYLVNRKHYEIINCSNLCKDKWSIEVKELKDEKSNCEEREQMEAEV